MLMNVELLFFMDMNILNVEKIFTDAVNPNIGRAVTIKKVNEEWNGKEFITNDVTGILEGCETYTDYANDGSMSFYLNVDGNTYDVTYRDFYFV